MGSGKGQRAPFSLTVSQRMEEALVLVCNGIWKGNRKPETGRNSFKVTNLSPSQGWFLPHPPSLVSWFQFRLLTVEKSEI